MADEPTDELDGADQAEDRRAPQRPASWRLSRARPIAQMSRKPRPAAEQAVHVPGRS